MVAFVHSVMLEACGVNVVCGNLKGRAFKFFNWYIFIRRKHACDVHPRFLLYVCSEEGRCSILGRIQTVH